MRLIVLLWATALSLFGFSCTSTGSGPWNSTGTWAACGGGVPHSGDSASVGNGHTITSASDVTVGGLVLVGSGTVSVTSGTFQVNGAITFDANAGCVVYNPAVTLSAGTTLKFDSIGPASGTACRSIVANGTTGSHVTITARDSTATARLGGNIDWAYVDVSNLTTFFVDEDYSTHRFKWNVFNSTFTNVAAITQKGCCGITVGGYFRHAWNVHRHSASATIFATWYDNAPTTLGGGVRDIVGNVFDKKFGAFAPGLFTIRGNYFGDSPGWSGVSPQVRWSVFEGNFVPHSYSVADAIWGHGEHLILD